MADSTTNRMLAPYMEMLPPAGFFTSMFQTPARNFHSSDKVSMDIVRNDPHLAIPLPEGDTGARKIQASKYTNKEFTPARYDEEGGVSAYSALQRRPGVDPFQDPDFRRAVGQEARGILGIAMNKIRRGVELQAAQVLQTGVVSLTDDAGNVAFSCDFSPKATHFVTVGTTWAEDGATGDPLKDLGDIAQVIRRDGKIPPDEFTFGLSAWRRFIANAKVRALLDNRRMEQGRIENQRRGGASFKGFIVIDGYEYDLWTYDETYIDPQSGNHTPYLHTDKVVVRARAGRLDLTYGDMPRIVPPDARVIDIVPPSMVMPDQQMGLSNYGWITPNGKHLMVSSGTRALAIPTAIDTFGCLDVTV